MNRSDYEAIVSSPGKFEGEQPWIPYFWDAFLNGCADDDTDGVLSFEVSSEDVALFPELDGGKVVCIREREDGFVVECSAPDEEDEEDADTADFARPTWTIEYISEDSDSYTVFCYCDNEEQARRTREELQSIAGSHIERDGDFLYALVSDPKTAREELEEAGYDTIEGA